ARQVREATECGQMSAKAGAAGVRASRTLIARADGDQAGVACTHRLMAQAQPLYGPRCEVLDHDVSPLDQPRGQLEPGARLQVQADAKLVVVGDCEHPGPLDAGLVVLVGGVVGPKAVRAQPALDPDHLRPVVGQVLADGRPGGEAAEFHNVQIRESGWRFAKTCGARLFDGRAHRVALGPANRNHPTGSRTALPSSGTSASAQTDRDVSCGSAAMSSAVATTYPSMRRASVCSRNSRFVSVRKNGAMAASMRSTSAGVIVATSKVSQSMASSDSDAMPFSAIHWTRLRFDNRPADPP